MKGALAMLACAIIGALLYLAIVASTVLTYCP